LRSCWLLTENGAEWKKQFALREELAEKNIRKAFPHVSFKYNSMTNSKKRIYVIAGIITLVAVFSLAYYYVLSQPVANFFADLGTANELAIVNGVATTVLALVAALNIMFNCKLGYKST
jgi:hypothetical protein